MACTCNATVDKGISQSLYKVMDRSNVVCLNEEIEGSGKEVFREESKKIEYDNYVENSIGEDSELLFKIPFIETVKLNKMIVVFDTDGTSPNKIEVYKNNRKIDFMEIENINNAQEWELGEINNGCHKELVFIFKANLFTDIMDLGLLFKNSHKRLKILYIHLYGIIKNIKREAVIASYELMKNKIKGEYITETGEINI
eukprot:GHVP01038445.1.p1 GENE.GHVP01038445.1~~GHVP01038445.1.p1  ORF type:complete len:199 (+),score=38.96 GHVP01038445.1:452-1048(+)